MTCNPKNIIRPEKGIEYIVHPKGDTADIITAIMDADAKADQYINRRGTGCLVGKTKYDTLRNVWRFVKNNLQYKADRPGYEVVKSPGALFAKGRGDCKSYSIAIAALLRSLGFTGIRYRFVSYKRGGEYTHVYVVCKLNGSDVILDAVYHQFDREATYSHKKDIPANGGGISGIHGPQIGGDIQDMMKVATVGLFLFGAYHLLK